MSPAERKRLWSTARNRRSRGQRPESAHEVWQRYSAEPEPCGIETLDDFRRALLPHSLSGCGTVRALFVGEGPAVEAA